MKSAVLMFAILTFASNSFAVTIFDSAKCRNEKFKPVTKVVGHTLCVKGKASDIKKKKHKHLGIQGKPQYQSLWCLKNDFQGLACGKYRPDSDNGQTKQADGEVNGQWIDNKWYPLCSTSVEVDAEGWGWENDQSCKAIL